MRTVPKLTDATVFVPETRKVLLEEMDTRFGGQNHVVKGSDLMGVEDAHHADFDAGEKQQHAEHIQEVRK